MGPLYIFKVGLPNLFSDKDFRASNPVEQDANARAYEYFLEKHPEFDWKHSENPILGFYAPWANIYSLDYNERRYRDALSNAKMDTAWQEYAIFGNPGMIPSYIMWSRHESKQ